MSNTFPKWYDFFMKPLERGKLKTIRRDLLQNAYGDVLEIGAGTGVNFPFYQNVKVTAIEPNHSMIDRSLSKKNLSEVPITIVKAGAEALPFNDNSFDTVVATLVFCTIPNVELSLKEMRRVCKPNGEILMFEHVKMKNPILARLQELLTPAWSRICDGCHLNRDTLMSLQMKGFKIVQTKEFYRGLFITVKIRNEK